MKEKRYISLTMIILALALFCSYRIYYYFVDTNNSNLVDSYYQEVSNIEEPILKKTDEKDSVKEEYLGILTIPKINLKTGFYNKDSSNNNVNKSVTLLSDSIMPNEDGSIMYLAAHSGVGYLAYFKDIDKLANEDIIKIDYHNKNYSYIITDIYEIPKTGEITVNHNINDNYLVLTTCSKNRNMQLVVISKLINKV